MLLRSSRLPKVVRLRPTVALDSDGDPVESWAAPQRARIVGAEIQSGESIEVDGVLRRVSTDERVLFVRGAVDLTARDRVEVDGLVWRVEGDPLSRAGRASSVYTRALLRRLTTG